jgi:hypothetical protein
MKGSITYEPSTVITHKFMEYGLYVAAGVGKGYVHGNGGSLSFLEGKHAEYYFGENAEEKEVGLGLSQHAMFNHRHNSRGAALTSGKHRQRRDWFSKKYLYSIYRLNEKESEYYGRKYWGLLSATLDAMFDKNSKLRSL